MQRLCRSFKTWFWGLWNPSESSIMRIAWFGRFDWTKLALKDFNWIKLFDLNGKRLIIKDLFSFIGTRMTTKDFRDQFRCFDWDLIAKLFESVCTTNRAFLQAFQHTSRVTYRLSIVHSISCFGLWNRRHPNHYLLLLFDSELSTFNIHNEWGKLGV